MKRANIGGVTTRAASKGKLAPSDAHKPTIEMNVDRPTKSSLKFSFYRANRLYIEIGQFSSLKCGISDKAILLCDEKLETEQAGREERCGFCRECGRKTLISSSLLPPIPAESTVGHASRVIRSIRFQSPTNHPMTLTARDDVTGATWFVRTPVFLYVF